MAAEPSLLRKWENERQTVGNRPTSPPSARPADYRGNAQQGEVHFLVTRDIDVVAQLARWQCGAVLISTVPWHFLTS